MRRVLLDVNVILDIALGRSPHFEAARSLWAAAERKTIEALVPAHGVTTVFYLASRLRDRAFARRFVNDLLAVPSVAAVDGVVLRRALALGFSDFEDAVCAAAAEAAGCDWLVTRDPAGFSQSPVLVLDPPTAVSLLEGGRGSGRVSDTARKPYQAARGRPARGRRQR